MEFIGVIGFDDHAERLESRQTNPASFSVIADWVRSVVEYYQGELNYSPECVWQEVRVSVYVNDKTLHTVKAEAIETIVLRKPYRD